MIFLVAAKLQLIIQTHEGMHCFDIIIIDI